MVCSARLAGHGPPVLSAWCSVTNLVAIVTSANCSDSNADSAAQAGAISVLLVEPGCPEEFCMLSLPAAGGHRVCSLHVLG